MGDRPRAGSTAVLLLIAAVGHTVASAGTFPGTNGKIAFSSDGEIEVIRPDGTGRAALTETPVGGESQPAWNAAGKKLVFTDSGHSFSTMNADGSNRKAIFSHNTFAGNPTWSPSGSVIAIDGFIDTMQGSRIFTVPAAGGSATQLAGVNAQDPTYSPDGTKIAYEDHADCCDIGVMNADGSNATTITSGPDGNAGDHDPSWSPDGTKIAFVRNMQIWTMGADGSAPAQLTSGTDASHPTWSPDGTKIAFERDADIWVMDADGSDAVSITNSEAEERAPDWGVGAPAGTTEGIEFAADAFTGSESGSRGSAVITVERTGSSTGRGTVLFSTSDGSAKASRSRDCLRCSLAQPDYLKASGILVFADGETEKTFRVPIVDDGVDEEDETVNMTLTRIRRGGGTLGDRSTAVLTITDNDPNVSFARSTSSGTEQEPGPRPSVLLSSRSSGASVSYAVTGGTATAGTDYRLSAGTLGFGTRGTTIPLTVLDDNLKEPAETVIIELSAPSGAELGPIAVHTYTIKDDDPNGDVAGDTPASALEVDLRTEPRQRIAESLLPAGDVDVYRVHLEAGEDLAIDVDPVRLLQLPGSDLRSSTLTILAPDGTTELASVSGSQEPDGSGATNNPAYLFHADAGGDYYLRLSSGESRLNGYRFELHRIALATGLQDPDVLDQDGPMFAWLRGNTLGIAGPTGYGFALDGNWSKDTTLDRKTGLTSAVYRLAQGEDVTITSAIGELQMGVATDIVVKTQGSTWGDVFGPVSGSSIPTRVTVPLGEFSNEFADVFGLVFERQTGLEIDQWEIKLGGEILSSEVARDREIRELLDGVPYFYSLKGSKASTGGPTYKIEFGPIDTTVKQSGTILIVDPTDPLFYVNFIEGSTHLVVANSSNGYVPFHPLLPPTLPEADVGLDDFHGHSFAVAQAPIVELFPGAKAGSFLAEARLTLGATRNIDVDANDDGTFLAGRGNVDQLLDGDLSAFGDVLQDLNIGANAEVKFVFQKRPFDFDVPLGEASFIYNGEKESVWFRARKGAREPLAGTPFSWLDMGPQEQMEGVFFSDGRFTATGGMLFDGPGSTELEFEVLFDNRGIEAGVRGDVKLEGSATIGGVKAGCTATAGARGELAFSYTDQLHMSGSLGLDGSVVCKVGGEKVASASIDISGSIDDGKIEFRLPYIGKKSITLF